VLMKVDTGSDGLSPGCPARAASNSPFAVADRDGGLCVAQAYVRCKTIDLSDISEALGDFTFVGAACGSLA
jgi:hypothetical protein